MKQKFYITPETEIMKVRVEGLLCTSGESSVDDPMKLPGTDWKDETIW